MTSGDQVAGLIDGSLEFDGTTTDYVNFGHQASLDLTTSGTLSAWVKFSSLNAYEYLVGKSNNGNDAGEAYLLARNGAGTGMRIKISNGATDNQAVTGSTSWTIGNWYYFAGTWNGSWLQMYVNGRPDGAAVAQTINAAVNSGFNVEAGCGFSPTCYDTSEVTGVEDEVRISGTDRSPGWIRTEYNNQNSPSTFYSLGSEVASGCTVTPTATPTGATWYDCNWQERKRITIDHTKVNGTQTNFPVLVSLASDSGLASHAQADADDILFTSSDGTTKLSHEIESYASGSGALTAWVKIPSVSPVTDTYIYLYYGNPASASQEDPAGTWSNGYAGVWHLDEAGTGNAADYPDSSMNGNNGQAGGGTAGDYPSQVAGRIVNGQSFDGINDYIATTTQYNNPQVFTESIWFKTPSAVSGKLLGLESSRTGEGAGSFDRMIYLTTGGKVSAAIWSGGVKNITSTAMNDGNWHYAVYSDDSSTLDLYIDGAFIGQTTGTAQNYLGYLRMGSWALNGWPLSSGNGYYTGSLDEAHYSTVVRSFSWVTTEYNNQNSPSTFSSVASEEAAPCTPATTAPTTAAPTPTPNPPWYTGCGWPYRKNITLNKTMVPSDQTDFTVLINLASDNDLKSHARADGYDILFTTSDGQTAIPFERES